VSQQPKLIDDELLSQFNTFFILGLADVDLIYLRVSALLCAADRVQLRGPKA